MPYFRPVKGKMTTQIEWTVEAELPEVAAWLIERAGAAKIWCFEGAMGSGKTTLIAALCRFWQVEEGVSSPTYGLVNEYYSPIGRICHFDLYRIQSLSEALDMGMEDYLFSGDYCLIEWPQLLYPVLNMPHLRISLRILDNHTRQLNCTHVC